MNKNDIPDELKGVADQYQQDMNEINEQDKAIKEQNDECLKQVQSVSLDNSDPVKSGKGKEEDIETVDLPIKTDKKYYNIVRATKKKLIKDNLEGEETYNSLDYSCDLLSYLKVLSNAANFDNYMILTAYCPEFKILTPTLFFDEIRRTDVIHLPVEEDMKKDFHFKKGSILIDGNADGLIIAGLSLMVHTRDDLEMFEGELELEYEVTEEFIKKCKEFDAKFHNKFFKKVNKFGYSLNKTSYVIDYIIEINEITKKYHNQSLEFLNKVIEQDEFFRVLDKYQVISTKIEELAIVLSKNKPKDNEKEENEEKNPVD